MALWMIFLVNIMILISRIEVLSAGECDELPENIDMNYETCCRFPNISDPAVEKKIEELTKHVKPDVKPLEKFSIACKIAQTLFTEMKLVKDISIDKEAFAKMIDEKVKDDSVHWRQPMKDAFDHCQKPITANAAKILETFSQAPFSIKKEDCDPQFLVMFLCLHLDTFANCPTQALKSTEKDPNFKQCSSIKEWFQKCGKDVDVLKKIIIRSNS